MNWQTLISKTLNDKHLTDSYRKRWSVMNGNQRFINYQGRDYLNFASNDYLGFSHDPDIINAWQEGAKLYGIGSGGSSHITGYSSIHNQLESKLASWLGYPRAVLFNSGYAANQAIIFSFMGKQDRIFADRLCHASILEAGMLSGAQLRRFNHNQPNALAKLFEKPNNGVGKTLVISEGVFSMDGDLAPLPELAKICQREKAWLMIDDAHGIGAYGKQGKGSCELHQIKPEILVITFGKAFGLSGAAVMCSEACAEYLLQCAKHLIYTTSMPIAQVYALSKTLQKIRAGDERRLQLAEMIRYFRKCSVGLPFMQSTTAIQPLLIKDNAKTLQLITQLQSKGVWVSPIRPPTVPKNSARLRITLSAFHSRSDIDQLFEALYDCDYQTNK